MHCIDGVRMWGIQGLNGGRCGVGEFYCMVLPYIMGRAISLSLGVLQVSMVDHNQRTNKESNANNSQAEYVASQAEHVAKALDEDEQLESRRYRLKPYSDQMWTPPARIRDIELFDEYSYRNDDGVPMRKLTNGHQDGVRIEEFHIVSRSAIPESVWQKALEIFHNDG